MSAKPMAQLRPSHDKQTVLPQTPAQSLDTLRILSLNTDQGLELTELQRLQPGLRYTHLMGLRAKRWVSASIAFFSIKTARTKTTLYFSITDLGASQLNEPGKAAATRSSRAAAPDAALPRRLTNSTVAEPYKPTQNQAVRQGADDFLNHPSRAGVHYRYQDQNGAWQAPQNRREAKP